MLLEFRREIGRIQQSIMIERICEPIFEWWCAWGVEQGVLDLNGANLEEVYEVNWSIPAAGYIHPVQEVEAYIKAMEAGFITWEQVVQELGGDPMETAISRVRGARVMTLLEQAPEIAYTAAATVNAYMVEYAKEFERPLNRGCLMTSARPPSRPTPSVRREKTSDRSCCAKDDGSRAFPRGDCPRRDALGIVR